MECKFLDSYTGVCTNAESPMVADCCPVPDTEGLCKYECREEPAYELTPKGCAIAALMTIGAIKSVDDPAADVFFTEFTLLMQKFGYIHEVP